MRRTVVKVLKSVADKNGLDPKGYRKMKTWWNRLPWNLRHIQLEKFRRMVRSLELPVPERSVVPA